jgi:hypothetical protein
MTLLTAHKILISSGIACFLFYGAWEGRRALAGSPDNAGWWAVASAAGALALGIYLFGVWRAK